MSFTDQAPQFDAAAAEQIAKEHYGMQAQVTSLPSERDQNFLLQADAGRFVLKLANANEQHSLLEAQNAAMKHLANRLDFCPRVIPTNNGDEIVTISAQSGVQHFARLVTYLPGKPLGSVKRHSPALFHDLGFKIGQVDAALQDFDHPALHRYFHWDLANGPSIVAQYAHLIQAEDQRALVQNLTADFGQRLAPLLPYLRTSVIHNDANDYNVLVGDDERDDFYNRSQRITGLIDFGDMLHSYTVGDLALGIAYAILNQPDPLGTAAHITRGYHAAFPLNEDEIAALFGLVTMRLCMSAAIAAEQQRCEPDNTYLGISQQPIRASLPALAGIHPRFAEALLRDACGLPPVRHTPAVTRWLGENTGQFGAILGAELHKETVFVLDLGIGSSLLSANPLENVEKKLTPRIEAALAQAGAKVGIGQYNEARYLAASALFSNGNDTGDQHRSVHLGIDLFAALGSPVYSPLDGRVHALRDPGLDSGSVLVLEHQTGNGILFYTLYRHLKRESVTALQPGQPIKKGQRLALIGDTGGVMPPHLHFQLITDLLEMGCDFPALARPTQREIWKSLSPNPNVLLGLPPECFPRSAPNKLETLDTRRHRLGGNLSIAYREPVKVVRGWKQYLFDDDGRRYIDSYNNVAHVGHAHPRVVEAGRRQMGVLNTNTRYLHDLINQYAEELAGMLPEQLKVCYFVNSGSEANELALRLARAATGQRDMIVLEAAYHGNTTTLIDISPYKHNGPGGKGAPDWVHAVPIPDDYRGAYRRNEPQAGSKYAGHVDEAIAWLKKNGRGLAGYIAESLPSVGGQIILPHGYLERVYRSVREAGGVCIADEVQTGFGRTGTHFWGFEMQRVTPDIVVLGKPIGNGHPIGAVVTTEAIAHSFDNGMEFFSTFGGNPVSCAIGLEVLHVVRDENLQEHARRVGGRLLAGLKPLVERYPIVGDVRGSGLFLGVELVRDRTTLEPAAQEAAFVSNRMREHGILLGTDGPFHNVVKIRPPMPFDETDANFLIKVFEKILEQDFGQDGRIKPP